MNTSVVVVGIKLKHLRKNKGVSQEQVAKYLEVSQAAYARMEKGKSHSWATHIEKICEFFEITPVELVKNETTTTETINAINDLGNAEMVNQLSKKLMEQYEERIKELKENIIALKVSLKKYEK